MVVFIRRANTTWEVNRFAILISPIQRIPMGRCGPATRGLPTSTGGLPLTQAIRALVSGEEDQRFCHEID
jgi:hypothetical protein